MSGHHFAGFIRSLETVTETRLTDARAQTVRSSMAAVRGLFDQFIVEGLLKTNIAKSVDLPKIAREKGTTPVLTGETFNEMIDAIPLLTHADYRDRALIALMGYSLFRISAALRMQVSDYFIRGDKFYLKSTEKRTKSHEMPVHDVLKHYIDDYLFQTGLINQPSAPLFQGSTPHGGHLKGAAPSPEMRLCAWSSGARAPQTTSDWLAITHSEPQVSLIIKQKAASSKKRGKWRVTKARKRQGSIIGMKTL